MVRNLRVEVYGEGQGQSVPSADEQGAPTSALARGGCHRDRYGGGRAEANACGSLAQRWLFLARERRRLLAVTWQLKVSGLSANALVSISSCSSGEALGAPVSGPGVARPKSQLGLKSVSDRKVLQEFDQL